jgi:hypothetical protein
VIVAAAGPAASADDPRLVTAYRAMRESGDVQLQLRRAAPEPKAPHWLETLGHWVADALRPVGRLLAWIARQLPQAPYARILLWSVIALIAAGLIWIVVQRVRSGSWRLRRAGSAKVATDAADDWQPEVATTHQWLREADRLAAAGGYAEAVHHLLWCSVEDIARRRPRLIRPALTSRDIAAAEAIPPRARALFAEIAALVERSLFGGRAVSADDWQAARTAYADFALPQAWRAAA